MKNKKLNLTANSIRKDIINMVAEACSGHPGGSLSSVELLTFLYFDEMKIDPDNPEQPDRDRFVLSKGHATPLLYSVLARRGFFSGEELKTFRCLNSRLQGHPNINDTPGVDMTTGSLGQGLSISNGMALAAELDNLDYRVFVLLGDGELQEGQIWEAVLSASHYNLDNLTAIIDNNKLQIDGTVKEIKNITPIEEKFRAFNWNTIQINGHNMEEIREAFTLSSRASRPTAIIANTVKGKGVSFMENNIGWHGNFPDKQQTEKALEELNRGGKDE